MILAEIPALSEDLELCEKFASEVIETNLSAYAARGQRRRKVIMEQIKIGKLAELLIARHFNLPAPDFKIYSAKDKSYAEDLRDKAGNLYHIKCQTQESGDKYGVSWVFQKRDKLTTAPKDDDVVVLATYTNAGTLQVLWKLPAKVLVGLYEPMKLPQLSSKCALYNETLIKELKK